MTLPSWFLLVRRRRVGIWVAVVAVVLATLSCNPLASAGSRAGDGQLAGLQAQATQTALADGNNVPSAAATAEPTVSVSGRLGERVAARTVAITVLSIETSQGTNDIKPEPGKVFLVLHLNVENLDDATGLEVDSGDFQLRDAAGDTQDAFPESLTADQIEDLDLAPSEKANGTIVFQVAPSDTRLHLLYDFNEKHIDIDLGR